MVKPTLIDLNLVELKCYPFMISLDEYRGSCNVLSPKNMCSERNKRQMINVKALKIISNKNEAKAMS